MAWDKTLPADTSKIRNLGIEIRPNWTAIEAGDATLKLKAVNLNNRTVSGPSNDPTAIANAYLLYSKEDASGNPQLYGIGPASNITQFSFATPTFASTGSTTLPGGMIMKWGSFTVQPYGTTTILVYPVAFPTATMQVFITPSQNYSSIFPAYYASSTNTQFTCSKGATTASLSSLFSYLAIGY
jgi:hypothetical protein